jgi:hypothetical protein
LPNSSLAIWTISSAWESSFAKNQGFGDFFPSRKYLRGEIIFERPYDGSYLVGGYYISV